MHILAVDPGKNVCGYALFHDKTLIRCGLSVLPAGPAKLGAIAEYHYRSIAFDAAEADRVYVEEMSLNRGRDGTLSKAIATANDLLKLQAVGAYIAGRLRASLVYVPPAKHDKRVTQNRAEATLSPSELEIVTKSLQDYRASIHHNLYDAVLHGLRAVGRYG